MDRKQVSDVAEECMDICFKTKEELVKSCMTKALQEMNGVDKDPENLPDDVKIFSYTPSTFEYVDYATVIARSSCTSKEIARELIESSLEQMLSKGTGLKRRTIEDPTEEEECHGNKRSRSEENERNLPDKLHPTPSGSMTSVSREYFPDSEFVYPGIYRTPEDGYALFCVDNGRYSNSWLHTDGVTALTWVTANKDKSRKTLESIASSTDVHVFRKIQGEVNFRYMGKVFETENVDKKAGTVELRVS